MIQLKIIIFLLILFSGKVVFGVELTLKDCITISLEKNPDLIVLKNNYESSKLKIVESRAGYLPQLSAIFSGTRRITPLSLTFGESLPNIPGLSATDNFDVTSYSLGLTVQQNIWDFGRTLSLEKSAVINKKLVFLQIEKKQKEIIYNVKKGYYGLLQAKSIQQIAVHNVADMEILYNSVNERQQQGMATKIDVLNAEYEYAKFKSEVPKSNHQIDLAKITLSNLLSNPADTQIEILEEYFRPPEEYPFGLKTFADCKNKTLLSRTEFKELDLQEKLAKINISTVYSEWFPIITAQGSYDLQDNDLRLRKAGWSTGLNISLPLFRGFRNEAGLKLAKKQLENISTNKQLLTQNIILQVKQNYYKVLEQKENMNIITKKLQFLENNLEATNAKYKEGIVTLTEFIEAQTKKFSCNIEFQQAIYSYYIALNELEYSIGGEK